MTGPAPVSRRSLLQAGAGLTLLTGNRAIATVPSAPLKDQLATPLNPAGKASGGSLRRPHRPLLLAHRGCSALRPEHTLGSYGKAIADGADFIEPDLVATKDGYLVARHENNIAETTDVASRPEFAARKTTKVVDGAKQEGWFTEDFTLAELQTLRARERLVGMRTESHSFDGIYRVCTFAEIAEFVAAEASSRGRTIGLIPEIKHSSYFAKLGLPLEPALIAEIHAHRYLQQAPIIVQSFEVANLKILRGQLAGLANVRLMQLIGDPSGSPWDAMEAGLGTKYLDMLSPSGLADIAAYADYVAPATRMLIPLGPDGRLGQPTGLVEAAHVAGLLVGTWTFRPENAFLAADFRNAAGPGERNEAGSLNEMFHYLKLGLDAFFTDDPRLGNEARHRL